MAMPKVLKPSKRMYGREALIFAVPKDSGIWENFNLELRDDGVYVRTMESNGDIDTALLFEGERKAITEHPYLDHDRPVLSFPFTADDFQRFSAFVGLHEIWCLVGQGIRDSSAPPGRDWSWPLDPDLERIEALAGHNLPAAQLVLSIWGFQSGQAGAVALPRRTIHEQQEDAIVEVASGLGIDLLTLPRADGRRGGEKQSIWNAIEGTPNHLIAGKATFDKAWTRLRKRGRSRRAT